MCVLLWDVCSRVLFFMYEKHTGIIHRYYGICIKAHLCICAFIIVNQKIFCAIEILLTQPSFHIYLSIYS